MFQDLGALLLNSYLWGVKSKECPENEPHKCYRTKIGKKYQLVSIFQNDKIISACPVIENFDKNVLNNQKCAFYYNFTINWLIQIVPCYEEYPNPARCG